MTSLEGGLSEGEVSWRHGWDRVLVDQPPQQPGVVGQCFEGPLGLQRMGEGDGKLGLQVGEADCEGAPPVDREAGEGFVGSFAGFRLGQRPLQEKAGGPKPPGLRKGGGQLMVTKISCEAVWFWESTTQAVTVLIPAVVNCRVQPLVPV